MNQDVFNKANDIQSKIESANKIIKALNHLDIDIAINWREYSLINGTRSFTHSLSEEESREMVTVVRQHFESRIAELEKEFEAL